MPDFDYEEIPVPRRYADHHLSRFWSLQGKYAAWVKVEIAAAQALGAPAEVVSALRLVPVPSVAEVANAEIFTGHDVMAFLKAWKQLMSTDLHEWVHRGMTSSDLVDSALAYNLLQSQVVLNRRLDRLGRVLIDHTLNHTQTVMVGRTHGRAAEVTTWGYRVADITMQFIRAHSQLSRAMHFAVRPKLSGPVGNYRHITQEQERVFAETLLGPAHEPGLTATQVVARDGVANVVFQCALVTSAISRLAQEIRLGSQSGIDELEEGQAVHRSGSSAMPHKRNPVTSENLTGINRLVRAQVDPVMDSLLLWNERDISHSSVERVALPTALILTAYAADVAVPLIQHLEVKVSQMADNVSRFTNDLSSATARNWLVEQGLDPASAWDLVRRAATNAAETSPLWHEVEKIGRRMIQGGNAPEAFNPNWLDLIKVCTQATTVDHDRTAHVFRALNRMIPKPPFPGVAATNPPVVE